MVLLALPPPDHLLIERDRGQFVPSRRRRMMANVRAERLLKIPAEPSPRDCSRASRPWWSSASWVGSAPSTPEQRERRKNTRARPHRRALTNSATANGHYDEHQSHGSPPTRCRAPIPGIRTIILAPMIRKKPCAEQFLELRRVTHRSI